MQSVVEEPEEESISPVRGAPLKLAQKKISQQEEIKQEISSISSVSSSDESNNIQELEQVLNPQELRLEKIESGARGLMRRDLNLMGFSNNKIRCLFKNEDMIEDTNHAVELLVKGPNGWIHKFVPRKKGPNCRLCNEDKQEHVNSRVPG